VGCPLMSPAHMPKRYPWTLHSCQRAMAAWVITRFKAQTQDAIDIAEQLIFDMRTGNWTSEANKRYYVAEEMRDWIDQGFHHYGYWLYEWNSPSGNCKPIKLSYTPLIPREDLPAWLPVDDIQHVIPQRVPPGFPDLMSYIASELD
jgi:hypothetical protein